MAYPSIPQQQQQMKEHDTYSFFLKAQLLLQEKHFSAKLKRHLFQSHTSLCMFFKKGISFKIIWQNVSFTTNGQNKGHTHYFKGTLLDKKHLRRDLEYGLKIKAQ